MAIDRMVEQRADAYRNNPAALQKNYRVSQDLLDLLALQKLKTEADAAKREIEMSQQPESKTIAEPDAGVILTAPVVVLIVTAASPCVRLSDANELAEIPVKPDPLPDKVPPTVKFPLVVRAPFDATVKARVPSV